MSEPVIPERWRECSSCFRTVDVPDGFEFNEGDRCNSCIAKALGTAESLVRELAQELEGMEAEHKKLEDCKTERAFAKMDIETLRAQVAQLQATITPKPKEGA